MESVAYRTLLFHEAERVQARSAVSIARLMLSDAHALGASDIHIDPAGDKTLIRLRIDGIMSPAYVLPAMVHDELIARLKILSSLRTDEHFTPQDGRFRFKHHDAGLEFDVRLSTLPTQQGESAVLRLLIPRDDISLKSLGMGEEQCILLETTLISNQGIILIVGPTGSGKTTTLYALVSQLIGSSRSIISIEDPVEYTLPGVRQVQVMPRIGLTFAEGLRALLRQDPDIIVLGEVRDAETANLAINAAYTGHLVLSTLHAADASLASARLGELGISAERIALIRPLVISQKLERTTCVKCTPINSLCSNCNGSGFKGRVGTFEVRYA